MWLFSRWANQTVAAELAAGRLPAGESVEDGTDDADYAQGATSSTAASGAPRKMQSGEVVRDLPSNAQPTNQTQSAPASTAAAPAPAANSHQRRPLSKPPPVAYFL